MAAIKQAVVIHPVLRVHIAEIGYNSCRKVLRFVHVRARRGAMGGRYATGALAASIFAEGPAIIPGPNDGCTVQGVIGSLLPYAASVERGAEIHNIFPKLAPHVWRFGSKRKPQLSFIWRGRRIFTPHVPMVPGTIGRSHPGQRGKRFLRNAMLAAAVRYRWRFLPGYGDFE
jgi:hypothetical protein